MTNSTISIIIPAFKEDKELNTLLALIKYRTQEKNIKEVIVVDFDHSSVVHHSWVKVLQSPVQGRSNQLSYGADHASGDVLYFLHADSQPPSQFDRLILDHLSPYNKVGCFRMNFDDQHPMLRFFAWFTQFNLNVCRGGDQSLFIERQCYVDIGGFNTNLILMEDIDIIKRAKKVSRFSVVNKALITSARKYRQNGVYNLQWRFFMLHLQYSLGYSQNEMLDYYKRNIR